MSRDISLDDIEDESGELMETPSPGSAFVGKAVGVAADMEAAKNPATAKTQDEPATLAEAIAELKRAEALPEATKAQKAIRDTRLAWIRPIVARLQEGVPTPVITAKDLGCYHHKLVSNARRERLELLARSNPEIAELLKERDGLVAKWEAKAKLAFPNK